MPAESDLCKQTYYDVSVNKNTYFKYNIQDISDTTTSNVNKSLLLKSFEKGIGHNKIDLTILLFANMAGVYLLILW